MNPYVSVPLWIASVISVTNCVFLGLRKVAKSVNTQGEGNALLMACLAPKWFGVRAKSEMVIGAIVGSNGGFCAHSVLAAWVIRRAVRTKATMGPTKLESRPNDCAPNQISSTQS